MLSVLPENFRRYQRERLERLMNHKVHKMLRMPIKSDANEKYLVNDCQDLLPAVEIVCLTSLGPDRYFV